MSVDVFRSLPGVEINNSRKVKEARKNHLLNNAVLASRMGNPDMLVYPAGLWDVENSTMPIRTLVLIDIVPFLFSNPRPDNSYSAVINAQLEAHKGYIGLPEVFANPLLSSLQVGEFEHRMQKAFFDQVSYTASNVGYEPASEKRIDQVRQDSIAEVLAGVIFWGADIESIRLGKFGDDFRVQFDLAGQEKTIVLHQAQIGRDFSRPGSVDYDWTQSLLEEFAPRRTGLLVKADLQRVSRHVIGAFQPDVIAGNCSVIDEIELMFGDQYRFPQIPSQRFPYHDQRWNGKLIGDVRVGQRVPVIS